jgi:hypothetical protein
VAISSGQQGTAFAPADGSSARFRPLILQRLNDLARQFVAKFSKIRNAGEREKDRGSTESNFTKRDPAFDVVNVANLMLGRAENGTTPDPYALSNGIRNRFQTGHLRRISELKCI